MWFISNTWYTVVRTVKSIGISETRNILQSLHFGTRQQLNFDHLYD